VRITVQVRTAEALRGLRAARREVRGDMVGIIADHGRRRVLPIARRLAPSIISDTIIIRETKTRVRLTTSARGKRRRIVGYSNFGGTISGDILPRRKKALKLRSGAVVGRVTKPRSFAGLHYLEEARDRELPALRRRLRREMPRAVQRRLDGIR
jgi:hypothetical protein